MVVGLIDAIRDAADPQFCLGVSFMLVYVLGGERARRSFLILRVAPRVAACATRCAAPSRGAGLRLLALRCRASTDAGVRAQGDADAEHWAWLYEAVASARSGQAGERADSLLALPDVVDCTRPLPLWRHSRFRLARSPAGLACTAARRVRWPRRPFPAAAPR